MTVVPAVAASAAEPAHSASARVAIEDEPEGAALRVLDDAGPLPFPVAVRVVLPTSNLDALLDARLDRLKARHIPVWLSVPVPDAQQDIERWRSSLRALVEKHGS